MALPSPADLLALDFTWRGQPHAQIEAKAAVNTSSIDYTWHGVPFVAQPSLAVQYLRPASDITAGAWTPSTGVDLYATLDETPLDDADYDQTATASAMTVKLSAGVSPGVTSGHKVRYRIKGSNIVTVELMQGASVLATWTHNPAPASFTTYEQTLSSGEAASITDYTDLRVRITAS